MPELKGSCHCGAVSFTAVSHGRHPYMRCYCGICRKQDGGGGYAINLSADASTMKIEGKEHLTVYRAMIDGERSQGERNFCRHCGCALWLYDPLARTHPSAGQRDRRRPAPAAPDRAPDARLQARLGRGCRTGGEERALCALPRILDR